MNGGGAMTYTGGVHSRYIEPYKEWECHRSNERTLGNYTALRNRGANRQIRAFILKV